MNERDALMEKARAGVMIVDALGGWNEPHRRALRIAAYMAMIEGKPLNDRQLFEIEQEFRKEEGYE